MGLWFFLLFFGIIGLGGILINSPKYFGELKFKIMNKKVLVPVIVVLAVAVLAGGYWAWQRYEQQRLARQFLSGFAGLGGGNASDLQKWAESVEALGEMENYEETGEEERELTPEEKFSAVEEIGVDTPFVSEVKNDIGEVLGDVFGGVKVSSYLNNYLGMGEGTGMVEFITKKTTTAGDLNKLTSAFSSRGFSVITSGVSSGEASLMMSKDNSQYTVTYTVGEQEVGVVIFSEINVE